MPKGVRSSKRLYDACYELVRHGEIAAAVPNLMKLAEGSDFSRDARQLLSMCKQLRRSGVLDDTVKVTDLLTDLRDVDRAAFDESQPDSVLVRRSENAEATLLVFSGLEGVFWITISLLHHYLRHYPVNILYVRDDQQLFHMAGLNGLGADYRTSLESLDRLIKTMGAPKLYCIGGSAGGYAAMRFGLDLRATATMTFSAPTTIDPAQIGPDKHPSVLKLLQIAPDLVRDLRPIYQQAEGPPRTTLCFGADHPKDAHHAKRMGDLPNVHLMPISDYHIHDTLAYFAVNQKFDVIFDQLRGTGS